jgi:uncharacterized protein
MVGSHPGLDAANGRIDPDVLAAFLEVAAVKGARNAEAKSSSVRNPDVSHDHRFAPLPFEHLHDARYGHLKFKDKPLWLVIVVSWALAFFEYLFQVPANRIGSDRFTLTQLKVMQECITIVVFTVMVGLLFRQMPRWNNIVSFLLIVAAVYFTFNFEK